MGMDPKANIFYGYCWTEPPEEDLTTDVGDWAETVLITQGHTDPWASHPGGHAPDWLAEHRDDIDAWDAAKKALTDPLPVDWGSHGDNQDPQPYLYIRGTRLVVDWNAPAPLPAAPIDPAWKWHLDEFLAGQSVEPPTGENQPGWWVAAYYG